MVRMHVPGFTMSPKKIMPQNNKLFEVWRTCSRSLWIHTAHWSCPVGLQYICVQQVAVPCVVASCDAIFLEVSWGVPPNHPFTINHPFFGNYPFFRKPPYQCWKWDEPFRNAGLDGNEPVESRDILWQPAIQGTNVYITRKYAPESDINFTLQCHLQSNLFTFCSSDLDP